MLIFKKAAYLILVFFAVFALTGCHPKVAPVSKMDTHLSCADLSKQIEDVKATKVKIESARGFSGRNVVLGLVFWPGIVINEVTGNSAEQEANTRLVALENIYCDKQCPAKNIDLAKTSTENPTNKIEEDKA